MIDRRSVLAGGAGLGVLALTPTFSLAARDEGDSFVTTAEDRKLDKLLSREFEAELKHSPQMLTALGMDKGARAWARSELNATGLDVETRARDRMRRRYGSLKKIDRSALSQTGRINYDVAEFKMGSAVELSDAFDFGVTLGPYFTPFVVTQLTGAWYNIPDFLDNDHPIETQGDAQAYLARLKQFGDVLDGESERIRRDAELGIIPPDFMIERTVSNLKSLRDTPPEESRLVQSVAERAALLGREDFEGPARKIFLDTVRPALTRQIDALSGLMGQAVHDAGCYHLPDGAEIYRRGLLDNTTRELTGEDVHELGLSEVARIHTAMDMIMRRAGYTEGSVGERVKMLNQDPQYSFENSDQGREELISYVEGLLDQIKAELPRAFDDIPAVPLVVRRVPVAIQDGAPGGYYSAAPLDGSRPAYYNINLRDVGSWSRWSLPSLTHHEGLPGHHLQISQLRQRGELPLYRRLTGFTAYAEGWALYAEKVARDLGVYENDEIGLIGQLQSELFRAVRLVVDSGIHHKRWSREKAIRYMMDEGGEPESAAVGEIERYAVWPGNACAYKIGELTITKLREEMELERGGDFDVKRFHHVILSSGPVPMPVLEREARDI